MDSKRWLAAVAVVVGSGWVGVSLLADHPARVDPPARPAAGHPRVRPTPAAGVTPSFGAVSGSVVSARGGIPGATVCAALEYEPPQSAKGRDCVQTDASGNYRFSQLAPGAYVISAAARAHEPGVAQDGRPVFPAHDAELKDVDIRLRPGGSELAGVILDRLGGPVPEARIGIDLSDPPRRRLEVTADQNGRFATWVAAGRVTLAASAPGYASARAWPVAPNRDVMVYLKPAGRIAGRVLHASDRTPASDVTVYATPSTVRADARGIQTDASGRFVLDGLEPDRYGLRAQGAHVRGTLFSAIDLPLGTSVDGIELLVQPAARVSGRVMHVGDTQPCQSGAVTLGAPHPLFTNTAYTDDDERRVSRHQFSAAIQPDGTVRLDGVEPGRYFVSIDCAAHDALDGPFALDVGVEDISDLLWHVGASVRLTVRVIDALNQPVPSANLFVEYPSLRGESTPTVALAADGRGVVETTLTRRPGRYGIQASNNLVAEPIEFELSAGQDAVNQTLRVTGSANIHVTLTTPQGDPVHDLEVAAFAAGNDDAWDSVRAIELGLGEYRIGPLTAGQYRVRVQDGLSAPLFFGGAGYTMRAGTSLRLHLTLRREAMLHGRVVDDLAAPIADAVIGVAAAKDTASLDTAARLRGQQEVLSAHDGSFTIGGLVEDGEYRLRATDVLGGAVVSMDVKPDMPVTVTIPRTGEVTGSALDTIGQPVEQFWLQVAVGTSSRTQLVTAPRGAFVLRGVMSGSLALRAWDTAGRVAAAEVNLDPGRSADITLAFAAGAPLEEQPDAHATTELSQ